MSRDLEAVSTQLNQAVQVRDDLKAELQHYKMDNQVHRTCVISLEQRNGPWRSGVQLADFKGKLQQEEEE